MAFTPVNVVICLCRDVEVDDVRDVGDVDTTSSQSSADLSVGIREAMAARHRLVWSPLCVCAPSHCSRSEPQHYASGSVRPSELSGSGHQNMGPM